MAPNVAVLSPHRDDAAFSCGLTMLALLRGGARVTVVNVFTQSDYAVDVSTVDAALPPVEGVSAARLQEDRNFLADLAALAGRDAAAVCLRDVGWLDAPLRLSVETEQVLQSPMDAAAVAGEARHLAEALQDLPVFDAVFAPLALGDHIDHRVAREAARLLLRRNGVCWYEDLPYAARMTLPDRERASRSVTVSKSTANCVRFSVHVPDAMHLKERLSLHYPSQIAPAVAAEMAEYAELWRGTERCGGAERWFATPECAAGLLSTLEAGGATLNEEKV